MKRYRLRSHVLWFVEALLVLVSIHQTATSQGASATDLLDSAIRTAVTVAPDFDDSEAYFWVSPRQILFLRPAPGHKQFRGVLTEVQTGSKTIPDAFNAYASPLMPRVETMTVSYATSSQVEHLYAPPSSVLSPDGKWLLWQPRRSSPRLWCAATLGGSQRKQWKAAPGAEVAFWLPEGQRWVELSRGSDTSPAYRRAVVHSLSGNDHLQTIRWNGVGDGIPLGITQKRAVLIYHPNRTAPAQKRRVSMAEIGLGAKTERADNFTVVLPHPAQVVTVILSPRGDHLAWLLTDDTAYSEHGEVWLSDTHGKQMQWLGRLEGETVWKRALNWLPDGKHLSFLHQSVIWTVAVPSGEKKIAHRTKVQSGQCQTGSSIRRCPTIRVCPSTFSNAITS